MVRFGTRGPRRRVTGDALVAAGVAGNEHFFFLATHGDGRRPFMTHEESAWVRGGTYRTVQAGGYGSTNDFLVAARENVGVRFMAV